MELEFLTALVLILGVSALSVFLLHRLRVPPIVGFIVAGILIGPGGLGLIGDTREIEVLAEIGVILLLFTVGIELSLKNLRRMSRVVILAGGGQVLLTISATIVLTYPFTREIGVSVFFGFLVALSSTAIVLKLLAERGEIDSPQGRMMMGILIMQDLCVVPFMLLTPSLTGDGQGLVHISLALLKAGAIIALVLLSARWIVPALLRQVVQTRSRELFLISIILVCLGTALVTSKFGLSLALGAFMAGLIVSESEYAYAATAEVLPLKESFMGLFFVSIGMLVDTSYIAANWAGVLAVVLAILFIKSLTSTASLLAVSSSARASIHAGMGLSQIGEFSFILAGTGKAAGLITGDVFQLFLSASVVTMALTPFILRAAPPASAWIAASKSLKRLRLREKEGRFPKKLSGHTIIIGFGLNGKNLAYTLKQSNVNYVVLDTNNETVRREKQSDEPIFFGDGTNAEILRKMGIRRAQVLVVVISDPTSTRKIVAIARKENPSLHMIVRTRYLVEVEDLRALGADEVIPEEFETSVEIFARVLNYYNVPINVIKGHIEEIRKHEYKALRTYETPAKPGKDIHTIICSIESEAYLVKSPSSIPGHSLREMQLRARTGATVIAVERDGEIHQNPSPDFRIEEEDILLFVGKKEDINRAVEYMDSNAFLRKAPDSRI